jgi:uncharacterized protein YfaS (alpha-2-macroglobulin family)
MPVPAEVALGVVDASIYALQVDSTPDLFSTFYGAQEVRVETDFSFSAQYSGGAFQKMPAPFVATSQGKPAIMSRDHTLDTNSLLDSWVSLGIQKLYRYQHGDGGWNWWEADQTDGDMTAYVLWGLVQAREAGYLVDDQRLNRGAECLLRMLKGQKELNARADWLLTLAYARPNAIVAQLREAYTHRSQLDTYALASLGLAVGKMSGVPLCRMEQPRTSAMRPLRSLASWNLRQ